MQVIDYDYTIIGAGCSGWQLAHAMMQHNVLRAKKIAICDLGIKLHRSWCFWSEDDSIFPNLVKKSWSSLYFAAPNFETTQHLNNYTYNYISGDSFFKYFNSDFLKNNPNISLLKAEVKTVDKVGEKFKINFSEGNAITSELVFDSRRSEKLSGADTIHLWQHFRGWFIETPTDCFDDNVVSLMDFTIAQGKEVRFMYVLPFSKRKALVEFTVFSDAVFENKIYDDGIKLYLKEKLKILNFKIIESENGAIPMTNFKFSKSVETNFINIGTNSGAVKPSTGYAFKRIHADSKLIAQSLSDSQNLKRFKSPKKFIFYDTILLRILDKEPYRGAEIFKVLFKKNSIGAIIRFLDEKTSLLEDISILSSLPWYPFLKHLRR